MKSHSSYSFSLFWIGITALAFIGIVGILKPENESMLIPVIAHAVFILLIVLVNRQPIGLFLAMGLILRIIFLYIDVETSVPVFSSGQDTENFYRVALTIYENPQLISEDLYGGVFPKLIGIFFWIVGPQRILVQYINILLSMATLILIAMSAEVLEVPKKAVNPVLFVCALMPISASISAIFLRESLITFLVAISIFWFCCWYKKSSIFYAVGSLLMIAAAGIFHLGVFGIIFGYIVAFFLYDHRTGRLLWTFRRVFSMLPILVGFIVVIISFSSLFLEKLETVSTTSDLLAKASSSKGGSAYLPGIEINSPIQFLMFGGIKAVLLLVSPPPWLWRSLMDIVSFIFDGLPFLIAVVLIIASLMKLPSGRQRNFMFFLAASLVATALIIGAGTANSGTAMRHRQKVVPLVAVSVIFSIANKRKNDMESEEESFFDPTGSQEFQFQQSQKRY